MHEIHYDYIKKNIVLKYYDDSNKLVIGKTKDETGGDWINLDLIQQIVGLKPKM